MDMFIYILSAILFVLLIIGSVVMIIEQDKEGKDMDKYTYYNGDE